MTSEKKKQAAWEKANPIRGKNPNLWRKDDYGNKIYKPAHGTQGEYGWEVDHRVPKSKGGSDSPRNLQALQWEKNREKGDKKR